jgi:hypothetical protein
MADGGGLYILIKPDGTRYWRYNYRHAGKNRAMAFGVYPEVSAKLAREKHAAARAQLAAGVDPMAERKQDKNAIRAAAADDFEGVAREMWTKKLARGNAAGYVDEVVAKLEKDVFPWIGRHAIAGITAADILPILERVEAARQKRPGAYADSLARCSATPSRATKRRWTPRRRCVAQSSRPRHSIFRLLRTPSRSASCCARCSPIGGGAGHLR